MQDDDFALYSQEIYGGIELGLAADERGERFQRGAGESVL
jgi:hypothetical protein